MAIFVNTRSIGRDDATAEADLLTLHSSRSAAHKFAYLFDYCISICGGMRCLHFVESEGGSFSVLCSRPAPQLSLEPMILPHVRAAVEAPACDPIWIIAGRLEALAALGPPLILHLFGSGLNGLED